MNISASNVEHLSPTIYNVTLTKIAKNIYIQAYRMNDKNTKCDRKKKWTGNE